ncbi:hypothetical protein [Streptomyces sp. NPDC005732]|uniref:hypothetical protein n=1 Tax=Streptomyces sp. NPDC005732 TaxID=3157057 RepID=UPI0033FD3CB7
MSITIVTRGRHTATGVIAQLRGQIRDMEADNRFLTHDGRAMAADLHTALIRGCQDAMLIAHLRAENTAVKEANAELRRTTIRAKAEQERLRQAVINARPKIDVAVQRLDRPYASHVQIPYPVPVGRSTANDETQQLAVIDLPVPAGT